MSSLYRTEGAQRLPLGNTLVPEFKVSSSLTFFHLAPKNVSYHTAKSFLACGIPQLEPDFQAIHKNLLRYKKCAGRRSRFTGIESALSVSVKQAGLANTSVKRRERRV